jgi:CheY-like chemotaxis protein
VPNEKLVLIVEDNEDDVFMLQHAFRKAGITNPIHVVRTGEDAIAYLAGADRYSDWNRFPLTSIVLLDLKLPGLSGLDVLAWIRKTSGLQNLRVTILTGASFGQQIKQASELANCAKSFVTREGVERSVKGYVAPKVGLLWPEWIKQ